MFTKLFTASNLVRATTEDLPSQVNHVWTVMALTAMGMAISMVQYVGDPIQCWCPAHMPEVHCNYTKAMCWIKETYYVDFSQDIPKQPEHRNEHEVTYYPWAPWILFFMAAMFKMPHLLWTGFAPLSDLDLESFVELADDDCDVSELAMILRIWIFQMKNRRKNTGHALKKFLGSIGFFWLGRHKQTFLTGLVLFVKVSYLSVSVLMFYSLRIFIDRDFLSYGYDTVLDFINGIPTDSERFPKNTICDIRVRQMNNVNTYSVQCILPINLYNEKIFLFLWYWYVLLNVTNAYSVMHWALNLLSPSRRWKFVNDYIIIMDHVERHKKIFKDCGLGSSTISSSSSLSSSSSSIRTGTGSANDNNNGGGSADQFSSITNGIIHVQLDHENSNVDENTDKDRLNDNNDDNSNYNNYNDDDDASLLSVGYNTDGTRLRVGNHVNFIRDKRPTFGVNRKKEKKRKKRYLISPTEADKEETSERMERRRLWEKTVWMYHQFDYDGVLVFRTLEMAVGVVVANDVFRELYTQMRGAEDHKK